jgi:hypothetical protein
VHAGGYLAAGSKNRRRVVSGAGANGLRLVLAIGNTQWASSIRRHPVAALFQRVGF